MASPDVFIPRESVGKVSCSSHRSPGKVRVLLLPVLTAWASPTHMTSATAIFCPSLSPVSSYVCGPTRLMCVTDPVRSCDTISVFWVRSLFCKGSSLGRDLTHLHLGQVYDQNLLFKPFGIRSLCTQNIHQPKTFLWALLQTLVLPSWPGGGFLPQSWDLRLSRRFQSQLTSKPSASSEPPDFKSLVTAWLVLGGLFCMAPAAQLGIILLAIYCSCSFFLYLLSDQLFSLYPENSWLKIFSKLRPTSCGEVKTITLTPC